MCVVFNEEQSGYRTLFAKASAYARRILQNPAKTASCKKRGEAFFYHSAIQDYIDAERHKKAGSINKRGPSISFLMPPFIIVTCGNITVS
jgi:hypothetical protein